MFPVPGGGLIAVTCQVGGVNYHLIKGRSYILGFT